MFKPLTVLRTNAPLTNESGADVPVNTRVVVVNVKDNSAKVRYGATKSEYSYIVAPVSAFATTKRGRPVLDKSAAPTVTATGGGSN